MRVKFDNKILFVDKVSIPTVSEVNDCVNFLGCTPTFVRAHGSKHQLEVLDKILKSEYYLNLEARHPELIPIVDSRTNHLTTGIYPSIPGWHCDNILRSDYNNQPDIVNVDNNPTYHFACLLCGYDVQVSGTEFLRDSVELDIDPDAVFKSMNNRLSGMELKTFKVRPNTIFSFDNKSIHRASKSTGYGTRTFFRLSLTKREVLNQILKQTQVYLDVNEAGW